MPITVICGEHRQIFDIPSDSAPKKTRTLARFLWLERRLPPRPLCSGIGHCGRCRVLFHSPAPTLSPSEKRMLSPQEQAAGVRLACRHALTDGMVVEVDYSLPGIGGTPATAPSSPQSTASSPSSLAAPALSSLAPIAPSATGQTASQSPPQVPQKAPPIVPPASPPLTAPLDSQLRLAVDLGTTSVAWQAEDANGHIMAAGQGLNPQMSAGSDVMSRLAESANPEGAALLRDLVEEFLQNTVQSLRMEGWHITEIGLAANPAMSALALGLDTTSLRAAPYTLPQELQNPHGAWFPASPLLPPIWVPPAIAPFVGGDISAGLALLLDRPRPFLLADMGTNGEFLLQPAREGAPLLAASVPLGPALEGVGMSCGGMAGPGGITEFHIGPAGLEAVTFDKGLPRHVCGTGYLSLLRCLRNTGLLDENGHFCPKPPDQAGPLEFLRKKLAASLVLHGGAMALPLPGGLFLTAQDVENLLQVKAAFSLAIARLLAEAHMRPADLAHVCLAGALGKHAPLDALTDLGFLPPGLASKTVAAGNTALRGVSLLLRDNTLRQHLALALGPRRVLDLPSDPNFHHTFIRHMRFASVESS